MNDETFYALLLLGFLLLAIFGLGRCRAIERDSFTDGGVDPLENDSKISCACHARHIHPREGLCWRKDVHGHYLQNPRYPCKSGKCNCWEKHIAFRNGRCHIPGQINGSMDACRIRPYNV